MEFVAVIERGCDGSFSAYVPDLPGCVACGDSLDEVRRLIQEAAVLHIESLREHGDPIPRPVTVATTVRVSPLEGWAGGLCDADAEQMRRVIADEFERVDPDQWKQ